MSRCTNHLYPFNGVYSFSSHVTKFLAYDQIAQEFLILDSDGEVMEAV